jgi:uronate dehydrogenase
MPDPRTILITGAAGNLGAKLRRHLEGRFPLRLLDRDPRGDPAITAADLSEWRPDWLRLFDGADTVVHLAADPTAHQTWPNLVGPNIDALVHVFQAAAASGVRRVVYASSNHVLGGYSDERPWPRLTPASDPRPGARYVSGGERRDSTAYAACKLFGERLGKCFAEAHRLSVVAVRIGWVRPGDNRPEDIPPRGPWPPAGGPSAATSRGDWFRLMWLSNRDYCHLMERSIVADLPEPFVIVHGMSDNAGMPWDIEATRRLLGYAPQDDVTRGRED